ncbi:MAG TPA: hypothetical protein VHE13_16775 [Opitutus sp.]|nr:hypothetical protein [Opitutus sp.]
MASRLEYSTPRAPLPGAREELDALIETLHTSGTLRAVNDFFGRLGELNLVVTQEANSPGGRNAIGALLFFGECLTKLPHDAVTRMAEGLAQGAKQANDVLQSGPPGTIRLIRILDDPETRRSLAAAAVLLNAVAASLARPARDSS